MHRGTRHALRLLAQWAVPALLCSQSSEHHVPVALCNTGMGGGVPVSLMPSVAHSTVENRVMAQRTGTETQDFVSWRHC